MGEKTARRPGVIVILCASTQSTIANIVMAFKHRSAKHAKWSNEDYPLPIITVNHGVKACTRKRQYRLQRLLLKGELTSSFGYGYRSRGDLSPRPYSSDKLADFAL